MMPTHTPGRKKLLLLVQSRANPKVSAYAHLYGPQDYNEMPFAPIGIEDSIHGKPTRRKIFVENYKKAYVLAN